jgi:integrase/recombinase XerC
MEQELAQWLSEKESGRVWSRQTCIAARRWSRRFLDFWQTYYPATTLGQINPEIMAHYRSHKFPTIDQVTQARECCYLRSFFAWAVAHNLLISSPILGWPKIRLGQPTRKSLTLDHIRKILTAMPGHTPLEIRDRAIVELFYATGIRLSELVALDLSDVDLAGGRLFVRHGKGDKGRMLPLIASARLWLRRYLLSARPLWTTPACHALFLSSTRKRRMDFAVISLLMKSLRRKTRITRLSPHLLRHTCATHLLQAGVSLPYLQLFLGHSRIATTQRYLHLTALECQKDYDLAHPRDKWNL